MCVGGEGEGEEKVVEQQTGALGNPHSSFSSSSSLLCIRWGFDKIFTPGNAVQVLLEKPAISLPLVNSMYEMDGSCYLVLLLTLYIFYTNYTINRYFKEL